MKKTLLLVVAAVILTLTLHSQTATIEDKTKNMEAFTGFYDFYWDKATGKIWLEIENLDQEILYLNSTSGGLGTNGSDRNSLGQSKLVSFKRIGPKVYLHQPNYAFRYSDDDPAREEAVENAFGASIVWDFKIEAETGDRILVDATAFLIRDAQGWAQSMSRSSGSSYKFDAGKSAFNFDLTHNFPKNTEFDVMLTFTGSGLRGPEAPSSEAITLKLHHSFIALPDAGFKLRKYDPRSSFMSYSFLDFANPFYENLKEQYIVRHRLQKKNPEASISEPVEPIIYYVDRGVPPDLMDAVLEGASWWNNAFEAAGYKNAFQVKLLPEGAHAMDIRYNMINWTNRSSRGWSYGSAITDPRTGEIIKGNVNMGALRIRQDFLILSGMAGEFDENNQMDEQVKEAALLRLKQLSAHEVGHTLGLVHNFVSNVNERSSVMDYPHPLIRINPEGKLDLTDAYTHNIGEWDKISIAYGYQDYPDNVDADNQSKLLLDKAFQEGILYLTDKDAGANIHPQVTQWDNGVNPTAELDRVMKIRQIAIDKFSLKKIREGESVSLLEEILVPVYFFHRYQIEAASGVIGGLYYNHTVRGSTQEIQHAVSRREQEEALDQLIATLNPANLMLPKHILDLLPPRAPDHYPSVESFSGYTGGTFDPIAAAENIADLTLSLLLDPARSARLINQAAMDPAQLGLKDVIDELLKSTFYQQAEESYAAEVQRIVNIVALKRLMALVADQNSSPQTKAIVLFKLDQLKSWLKDQDTKDFSQEAHYYYCLELIKLFEKEPDTFKLTSPVKIPNGAPIGG